MAESKLPDGWLLLAWLKENLRSLMVSVPDLGVKMPLVVVESHVKVLSVAVVAVVSLVP